MKSTWILCAAFVGLSACGSLQSDNQFKAIAGQLLANFSGPDSNETAPEILLTRAEIEAQPTDLLRVSIISRDAVAFVVPFGSNGTKTSWISADGLGLTFDRGLLVGTRGFGDDLMGSDVDGAVASLRGGGNHMRVFDFLNGLDQIERLSARCTTVRTGTETLTIFERTYATNIFTETCRGDEIAIENTFWSDANGTIWQSNQWVSPTLGYFFNQRL